MLQVRVDDTSNSLHVNITLHQRVARLWANLAGKKGIFYTFSLHYTSMQDIKVGSYITIIIVRQSDDICRRRVQTGRLSVDCVTIKCQIIRCRMIDCQMIKCQMIKCQMIKCQMIKCQMIKFKLIKCQMIKCRTILYETRPTARIVRQFCRHSADCQPTFQSVIRCRLAFIIVYEIKKSICSFIQKIEHIDSISDIILYTGI